MPWEPGNSVTRELTNGALVLRLSSSIEYTNAEAMLVAIETHLIDAPRVIAIDMHDVPMVDSSGIGIFVRIHQKLAASGQDLRFFDLSQQVSDVFRYTNLFATFAIFDSERAALGKDLLHG